MQKHHSCEQRTSEIVLAEMDFQREWSQEHSTGFETLQLEEQPTVSQQERIEKELQRRYSLEERVFLIVNKQTGEVFDSRNQAVVDNLLQRNTITGSTVGRQWATYWKDLEAQQEQFIEAATHGNATFITRLLQPDAGHVPLDPNLKSFDDWTALHYTTLHGHYECAELLLKRGANPNQKSKFGWAPLHIAAKQNELKIAGLLMESGCQRDPQDAGTSFFQVLDFYTPLHYAAECGFAEMVQLLIKNGCDQRIRNCQGRMPRDCSQNIHIFNIFGESQKQSYSKEVYGGVLLPNSRTDHIQRLLNIKHMYKEQEEKPQAKNDRTGGKFVNIIKMYQTLKERKADPVGLKDFTFYKLLGRGSFGEVYLVKRQGDERPYALKVLRKEKVIGTTLARYIQTQKDVLSFVSHPFIVRLYYAFQSETRLFLVMQYCPGGDLSKIIEQKKKFTEEVARIYICEIILALEALHKNMVIYRDLKPQNLVLDEAGHVMVTDFGLSKKGEIDKMNSSFCGTPAYLAPEILDKKGHNRMADWYQMGVVLYEFLVGTPPFYAPTREELYKNKRMNILKIPKHLSDDCKDLIVKLLARDPNKRLGIEKDGQSIREHPWFRDIDWQKVYNRELKPPVYSSKPTNWNSPINIKFPEGNAGTGKVMPEWSFFA